MAKLDRKKFIAGYQKSADSARDTAVEKLEKLRKVEEKDQTEREKYEAKVLDIPYDDILPNPKNRNANRNIEDLAESILSLGLINYPRVVADGKGKYILTSGERRWRAIGLIRKTHPELFRTVPCTYGTADTDELDEEARLIVANSDVEDLSPEEYRKSIERLREIFEAKKARGDKLPAGINSTIAKKLSITPRQVQKIVSINQKLIPELQAVFDKQGINISEASNISQLDPIFQNEIYELFVKKGDIEHGDISYYRAEDQKLRQESAEQKEELDRLRAELAALKSSDKDVTEEAHMKQIQKYESTIDELTKVIKSKAKSQDKTDDGQHMLVQDAIARLERAQNNVVRQSKGCILDEIERKRLSDVINKLNALL